MDFVKTEINGSPKVQCLVNTGDQSELPSQSVTVLLPGHQRNMQSCAILMGDYAFSVDFLDAFHRELLLVGLMGAVFIGINHLVFLKELIIEDSIAMPPYTHHLLWMRTGF